MRVLIADDHEIIRTGLKQILLDEFPFAYIEEAEDGEQLLQKALSSDWELVISDISMPLLSGLEALQAIRRQNKTLPILIISMPSKEQYEAYVLRLGATAYMSKDAATTELITAVRQIITK